MDFNIKTYITSVRFYIRAESEEDLQEQLEEMGISSNEYYGFYSIEDIEEDEE